MLKLALIRQKYTVAGGAERFVTRTLNALMQRGDLEVTLIVRQWHAQLLWKILTVNPFFLGNVWREWSFSRAVKKLLPNASFDLVQSHERIPGCMIYRAGDGVHKSWLLRRTHKKGWLAQIGIMLNPFHHYMLATERKLFLHPDLRAVICISQFIKEDIERHYGVNPNKLAVIYNGVDSQYFRPEPNESIGQSIRNRFKIPATASVGVFVGSGFERKGLATIIKAYAKNPDPEQFLLVVGNDKHRRRYQEQTKTLGIEKQVFFVGVVADPRPYYAASNFLVMAPIYEPFGNVCLEAMASGLAVVTSSATGHAELIQDGVNGFVSDPVDENGFATAIVALRNKTRACLLGVNARKTAERYTLDEMVDAMMQLYNKVLAKDDNA